MTTHNEVYLKRLFGIFQPGCVITSDWLEVSGISRNLQKYYLKSGWIESVGRGAYKKPGEKVEWQGALFAIQKQGAAKVHVGGLSALTLQGYSHYFRMAHNTLQLYSPLNTRLPKWFTDFTWGVEVQHHLTSFLPLDLGLKEIEVGQIKICVSTPERAILECLYLAPQCVDLVECYQLLEGMVNLMPGLLNELLSRCNSVKVKRLFLYLGEKSNHQWFKFLDVEHFDLGKGNRMLAEKGIHIPKYMISIPKELAEL